MTISRTFQWYRHTTSDPTVSPVTISGATTQSYTTVTADVGKYLHLKETASNSAGSATATSNVVGAIAAAGTTFTPESGTIAPIDTQFGDRDVIPLPKPWWELDTIDSERNTSLAMHNLMCAGGPLYTESVRSGRWSDPATWSNGVPQAGGQACIETDHTVLFDVYMASALKYLTVHGAFRVDTTLDTKLIVDTIHSHYGSYYEVGTATSPVPESSVVESNGKRRPRHDVVFIGDAPGTSTRLGAMWMGEVSIYGADKTEKVDVNDITAGQTTFTIKSGPDITGWVVGDEILALSRSANTGSTGTDATYKGSGEYWYHSSYQNGAFDGHIFQELGFKTSNDEVRTITAIDYAARTVTVNSAFTYNHATRTSPRAYKDGSFASLPARVCNISRSVSFRSGGTISDHQQRAHSMVMHCDRYQLHNAMFIDMGRSDIIPEMNAPDSTDGKQPRVFKPDRSGIVPKDPNNVRGRYPVHSHGTGRDFSRNQGVFNKLVVKTSGAFPTPGWAYTHHNSRTSINNCIAYNTRGAAFVSEAGTEIGQWIGNTAAWCRGNGFANSYEALNTMHNRHGGGGVAFSNQSRNVLQQNNEFTSCHYGWDYFNAREAGLDIESSADHTAMRYFNPTCESMGQNTGWTYGTNDINVQQVAPYGNYPDWGQSAYGAQQQQIPDLADCYGCDFTTFFNVGNRDSIQRGDVTPAIFKNWIGYGGKRVFDATNYTWFYYWTHCAFWGGPSTSSAFQFGARTVQFSWRDCCFEGFSSFSNGPGSSLHGGQLIDVNMPYAALAATGDFDGTQGAYTSSGSTYTKAGGGDFTYVTPSFAFDDSNVTHNLVVDYLTPHGGGLVFEGTVTDTFGTRPWMHWYDPGTGEWLGDNPKISPSNLVRRNGCYQAGGGVWKSRLWYADVDRALPPGAETWWLSVDVTLINFPSDILAANDTGSAPAHPDMPLPPESIKKPLDPIEAPVNTVVPAIVGGGPVAGVSVWCEPGTWTGSIDAFAYSWRRNGVEVATTRRYTYQSADIGQQVTCVVFACNAASNDEDGASATSPAVTVQAAAQTPQQIFGSALVDVWSANQLTNRDVKDDGTPFPGVRYIRDGEEARTWTGVNGKQFAAFHSNDGYSWGDCPSLEMNGWSGGPCLRSTGVGDSGRMAIGLNVTNPHFWLVLERPNEDQPAGGRKGILECWPWLVLYVLPPSSDAAQNKIGFISGSNGGGTERTTFPKTTRTVAYIGRDSQGTSMSIGGLNLTHDGTGANGSGSADIRIFRDNESANIRIKAIVMVDKDVISPSQHAAMQTYLAQMFP